MVKSLLIAASLLIAGATYLSAAPNPKNPHEGTYTAVEFLQGVDSTVKLARGLKLDINENIASLQATTYVSAFMDGLASVQLLTGKKMVLKEVTVSTAIFGLQKFIRENKDNLDDMTARVALTSYLVRAGVVKIDR